MVDNKDLQKQRAYLLEIKRGMEAALKTIDKLIKQEKKKAKTK